MKKILFALAALVASVLPCHSAEVAYNQQMINTTVTSSTVPYVLDLGATGIDDISFQATYSSASPSLSTFTDGQTSTNTITIVSTQPLVGVAASDFINVLSTNGLANAVISLNGYSISNNGWRIDKTSDTAVDIATEINQQAGFGFVASTATTTKVEIDELTVGTFANAYTLSIVNTSSLTATSATFSGGVRWAALTINGTTLTAGTTTNATTFQVTTSSKVTATNLQTAINLNPSLSAVIIATAPSSNSVVFTTSTAVGTRTAYAFSTTDNTNLKVGSTSMIGGSNSAFAINSGVINVPNHGLSTGFQVWLSTPAGISAPVPLRAGTTYFVLAVDSNNLELSTTSAQAFAGTFITILSSSTSGPHSFGLNPLPLVGAANLTWQASNDSVNWTTLTLSGCNSAIGAIGMSTTSNSYWDMCAINPRYIRALLSGPTQGGVNVIVTGFGKRYWR